MNMHMNINMNINMNTILNSTLTLHIKAFTFTFTCSEYNRLSLYQLRHNDNSDISSSQHVDDVDVDADVRVINSNSNRIWVCVTGMRYRSLLSIFKLKDLDYRKAAPSCFVQCC